VLVLADAKVETPPEFGHLIAWLWLAKQLRKQPVTLDEVTIASAFDAARKSPTWQPHLIEVDWLPACLPSSGCGR